jgi:hypothetical protein
MNEKQNWRPLGKLPCATYMMVMLVANNTNKFNNNNEMLARSANFSSDGEWC